ncbi:hypothetical protein NPIL_45521 [Nephila pilipes]|uniref:Uncharacterized protein n=1 Tax=Nephila pilipes TaxID=299642 RepID=A0A8X6TTA3_NEPPI|nr:hypothetical protein NPIL_45521 [Nephila pilipes]
MLRETDVRLIASPVSNPRRSSFSEMLVGGKHLDSCLPSSHASIMEGNTSFPVSIRNRVEQIFGAPSQCPRSTQRLSGCMSPLSVCPPPRDPQKRSTPKQRVLCGNDKGKIMRNKHCLTKEVRTRGYIRK